MWDQGEHANIREGQNYNVWELAFVVALDHIVHHSEHSQNENQIQSLRNALEDVLGRRRDSEMGAHVLNEIFLQKQVRNERKLLIIVRINRHQDPQRWQANQEKAHDKWENGSLSYDFVEDEKDPANWGGASSHEGEHGEEGHDDDVLIKFVSDVIVIIKDHHLNNSFHRVTETPDDVHIVELAT